MAARYDCSSPQVLLKSRRKAVARKVRRGSGWTKKRAAAVEAILWGGALTLPEAAKAAGISERGLREAFRDPEFLRRYRNEVDVQRSMERARNLHQLIAIRDDPALRETAVGANVIVAACRAIEALAGGPNVVAQVVSSPGIVIGITNLAAEARKAAEVDDDGELARR